MPWLPSLLFSIMCRIQGGTRRILIAPRHGEVKTGGERSLSSGAAVDTLYCGLAYINMASLTERRKKETKLNYIWGFGVSQAQMMCEMSFHWWLSASDDNADSFLFFFRFSTKITSRCVPKHSLKTSLFLLWTASENANWSELAWLEPSSQTESAETREITEGCERGESLRKSWGRETTGSHFAVVCTKEMRLVMTACCQWGWELVYEHYWDNSHHCIH